MKTWNVKIEYTGLTGKYVNDYKVEAKTAKSAEKKAWVFVGDRTADIVEVKETKITKVEIVPHPPEVIDVDPEIIETMKRRLNQG
jgi:hypothetical protein